MKRGVVVGIVSGFLLLGGFAGYQARESGRQRERLAAATDSRQRAAEALAAMRRKQDALRADLAEAERQLAALPVSPAEIASQGDAQAQEMHTWLVRLKTLQRRFESDPKQRIPELQLLEEADWLRVAKHARLDTEEGLRRACSDVRNAAIARFAARARPALRAYMAARGEAPPESAAALAAYFSPPIALDILAGYEIAPNPSSRGKTAWQVQNRSAVDPDFDVRYQVSTDGGTRSSFGPVAWVPDFYGQLNRAVQAYRAAHQRDPGGDLAAVVPYFNPLLEPRVIERLLKSQQERR